MNRIILLFAFAFFSNEVSCQVYSFLSEPSSISWTGYAEVGGFEQTGVMPVKKACLELSENQIKSGELTIDMQQLTHADAKLEKHLKAKDFFYIKKYPEATFVIKLVTENQITGDLTLRGITKSIQLDYRWEEIDGRINLKGEGMIDRTTFDIKYNSSTYFQDLGSYAIKNEFKLVFDLWFQ